MNIFSSDGNGKKRIFKFKFDQESWGYFKTNGFYKLVIITNFTYSEKKRVFRFYKLYFEEIFVCRLILIDFESSQASWVS